jgi:flagellar basal body rod protein FlgG
VAIPTDQLDFFSVSRDGQPMLTRAGNFNFDRIGMLVSAQGFPVLGTNDQPIVSIPGGPQPQINPDGSIRQGGNLLGVMKLSRVGQPGDLAHAGENLFSSLAETSAVPVNQRNLQVGFLEQSGVKPTVELMELTEASRAYQANISMIQHHDSVLSSLVNRVMRS